MATSYSCYALSKEDADSDASYQVSSTIHKNNFTLRESLFYKLSLNVQ